MQSEQHIQEEKSESSAFGIYENTFYIKLEKDKEIEMAVQCPFDKSFKARKIGENLPDCIQCPYIEDDIVSDRSFILAKKSQDTSCQNCKSLYDLSSRSVLEEFFFQEHCLAYTPPPPPEPEVVEPEPEPEPEEEIVVEPVEEEEEIVPEKVPEEEPEE